MEPIFQKRKRHQLPFTRMKATDFSSLLSEHEKKHVLGETLTPDEHADLYSPLSTSWSKKFSLLNIAQHFVKINFNKIKLGLPVALDELEDTVSIADESLKEVDISFLPLTLLPNLIIEEMVNNIDGFQSVPMNLKYDAVLLIVDVSGFTPLTEMYNHNEISCTDNLVVNLNRFMSNIAACIMSFGGDILNFAGDAYLCQWEATRDEDIIYLTERVFKCAVCIQTMPHKSDISHMLRVKVGIALGEVITIILGSPSEFLLFAIAGRVLLKVRKAEDHCGPGEIVVSDSVFEILKIRDIETYTTKYISDGYVKITGFYNIQNKDPPSSNRLKLFYKCEARQLALSKLFCMPVLRDIRTREQLIYLSEVTEVTILFMMLPEIDIAQATDLDLALQSIMFHCQEYEGTLNKVILFDKGCTFLLLFGLPGLKHLNDPARAVYCADFIIRDLKIKHGISVTTGISSGTCFCGIVGHALRREYTVIGWRVNLACRLMTTYFEEPVVLDSNTYYACYSEIGTNSFVELKKRRLKGIKNVPDIYAYRKGVPKTKILLLMSPQKPLSDSTEEEQSVYYTLFVLRHKNYLKRIRDSERFPILFIKGAKGSGRTFLLYYAANVARTLQYNFIAFCAKPLYVHEPFSSVFGIIRLFLKIYSFKYSTLLESLQRLLSIEKDPYIFVLNHLLNTKLPTPPIHNLSVEVMNQETERLLKMIFKKMCRPQNPLVIAVDDANNMDFFSWKLLMGLIETEHVALVATVPLHYLPSCSASAVMYLKSYFKITLCNLNEGLISAIMCWYLNVQNIHEDVVNAFKIGFGNTSLELEEFMNAPLFDSLAKVVSKTSIDPIEIKSSFIMNRSSPIHESSLCHQNKVCDRKMTFSEITEASLSLGGMQKWLLSLSIQDRIILKRAAVLGSSFTWITFRTVNMDVAERHFNTTIQLFIAKKIFAFIYDSENNEEPMHITKKHPTIISIETEDNLTETQLPLREMCFEEILPHQTMKFVMESLRESVLNHMTKEQRLTMHLEIAETLEKRCLTCINCLEDMQEFKQKDDDASVFVDATLGEFFRRSNDKRSLQLIPKDLRNCSCLEQRVETYKLISSIYNSAGLLLLSIKHLIKAAEICIWNQCPFRVFAFTKHALRMFPLQYTLENYIPMREERKLLPVIVRAALHRVQAQAYYKMKSTYNAGVCAMKALSILEVNVVELLLNSYKPSNLQIFDISKLQEIADCFIILCKIYYFTKEYPIAYKMVQYIEDILRRYDVPFIKSLQMQSLIYKCRMEVSLPLKNFSLIEDAILYTVHCRMIYDRNLLTDILELKMIAKMYITLTNVNLNRRNFIRAEAICREGYRILKCVHDAFFIPRLLALAIEICYHSQKLNLFSLYLNHLRSYALKANSKIYAALFYCGLIRYVELSEGLATSVHKDRMRQCGEFVDTSAPNFFPCSYPSCLCYFIAAKLALWCLASKPVENTFSMGKTFVRWYELAKIQRQNSTQSYWRIHAELTMIRIDFILHFIVFTSTLDQKKKHYNRIVNDVRDLFPIIKIHYPVLEGTWRNITEELYIISTDMLQEQKGTWSYYLQKCTQIVQLEFLTFPLM